MVVMKNNLRAIRKQKGATQAQISCGAGISEIAYKYYENGKLDLSIAKFDTILKLTEVLSCKASDLFVMQDYADRIKKLNRKRKW